MSDLMRLWHENRNKVALSAVLALGLYLRLWRIHDLFAVFHDYDPGAYSLGARFILDGYMPYRDFVLVHPPLYDLVLAGIYRVLGYDFFYGRYLSIALSAACIVLLYVLGRKLYNERAGLVAAALFAVEPLMVYFGRRCVQEMLGITLVLCGVLLALEYLDTRRRLPLFLSGVLLGLAVASKYVFGPVIVAVAVAVWIASAGPEVWKRLRHLGNLRFWSVWACVAMAGYSLLFLLKYVMRVPVVLPLIEPTQFSARDVSVLLLVFVVPLLVALLLTGSMAGVGRWFVAVVRSVAHRAGWCDRVSCRGRVLRRSRPG